MNIEEIHAELRKLDARLKELQNKKVMTPEDVTEIETIVPQIEELLQQRDVFVKINETRSKLSQPVDEPAGLGQPNAGQQGFRNLGEYLQAVIAAGLPTGSRIGEFPTGIVNRNLREGDFEQRSSGLEEATPSLGGFMVQTDFSTELLKKAYDLSTLYSRIRKIPIGPNANGLKINYIDETSRASGSRWGGITIVWLGEGGTKTASYPKLGQIELKLKKVAGICYLTDEVIQDAPALGSYVSQAFADEFSFVIDDVILHGTGAAQPLGILNGPSTVSVAKETGQAAATIVWENLKKMYARLWSRSRPNMIWMANQDTLPQLMSMSQPVGTGGVPVWQAAGGATGQPNDSLLGRPILFHESCPTLGTVGDICLIDPTQYLMITKGGLQSASSIHVRFINDETTLRFVLRIDGQPLWQSALTPKSGSSNTLSPYITLATRS